MSVKIRLSRIGKKKAPFYRIVAVDSRKKRDGANLEILGTYDGLAGVIVNIDMDRIDYWLGQGAIPSETVEKLIKAHKRGVEPGKEVKAKKAKAKKAEPVKKEAEEAKAKTEDVKAEKEKAPEEPKTEPAKKEKSSEEAKPEAKGE